MSVDFDFRPYFRHSAFFINNERRSLAAHRDFAVHVFLFPNAVRLHHFCFDVREQRKRQIVLLLEFCLRLRRILRNANDDGLLFCECFDFITEVTGFARSARRVGLRIEEEDNFLSREIYERNRRAVVRDERERGRLIPNAECHF